jgi:hypothetical protein
MAEDIEGCFAIVLEGPAVGRTPQVVSGVLDLAGKEALFRAPPPAQNYRLEGVEGKLGEAIAV